MLGSFGETQQALLKLLLKTKDGLTIDEIAEKLTVSRTAVRQHLTALARDGHVAPGQRKSTKGRPSQVYVLTATGLELFPRRYSWFSELMLGAIKKEKGSAGARKWLAELGRLVAEGL